jgi:G:T-mismatch repair DNA endonuclease (very short patch repair protein)
MKDGSVVCSIEDGQITDIALKADLDHIYGRMFSSARVAALKNPDKIRNGIKAIIFGCFWMEAKCNNFLKYLINHELVKEHLRKSVWESLERVDLLRKLNIFLALAQDIGFAKDSTPLRKLKKVIKLRNRLAHAKEKEIPFEESCAADTGSTISETVLQEIDELIKTSDVKTLLANLFQELPEPDLMVELKAPKINEHLETMKTSAALLDSIYKSYCRSIHIKVSSPKL